MIQSQHAAALPSLLPSSLKPITHTMSVEKVLAQWDEDVFTATQPVFSLPLFGGLFQAIGWQRSEKV